MKDKLFKVLETGKYGIGLAVDIVGCYVLEMKDGSGVQAFKPNAVEIVMPFTFAVQFERSGTEYHYLGNEGEVAVGDFLISHSSEGKCNIATVTAVNTKSERVTKRFPGAKLVTVSLSKE